MPMPVTRPSGLAESVPLAGLTTLGVGGPARYYVRAASVESVAEAVSWTITRVRVLDLRSGEPDELDREECRFGYRDSRFKREDRGRYVILGVTYRLRPGEPPSIRYADLERHLAAQGIGAPTLADTRRAVIDVRRRKSMVIDPGDPNRRSVGSFFMNP